VATRAEIVTEIYADLGFRGALEGLREATVISELRSEKLFEVLVEDRRSDSESLDETRNKVAELLELVDVDPDTQQATIYGEGVQGYFGEKGLASFWRAQNAAKKADYAEMFVEHTLGTLTEDKLVQWSIARHMHNTKRITTPPAETLQTVRALDRSDTTLREHAGETMTFINRVGHISTTTNDGVGLRAYLSRFRQVAISAEPTYTVNSIDFFSQMPTTHVDESCRIDFTDAVKLGAPENKWDTWSATLRSPTWRRSAPLLLFGVPVEGPFHLDDPYHGNNMEDIRYYEYAIGRARLVAGLALGTVTLDEIMQQGITLVRAATTPETS
jgi:hypothetical protein